MPQAPALQAEQVSAPTAPAKGETLMLQESRMARMKEYFKNQPKEKIRIRPDDGEQWVQINSYAFRIQAGQEVKVPKDVADTLREAGVL